MGVITKKKIRKKKNKKRVGSFKNLLKNYDVSKAEFFMKEF
jgi:hypothetical protein